MRILRILRDAAQNRSTVSSVFAYGRFFSERIPRLAATFGIAFDIDGVILRGETPIGGSVQALKRLYDDYGDWKLPLVSSSILSSKPWIGYFEEEYVYSPGISNVIVPYVFLTNGGGVPESKRAAELSKLLGVHVLQSQVIQGHSPFKKLARRFGNELVIAVGKGEPETVMSEYGFKNVLSIDEYASYFEHIDPLEKFKTWRKQLTDHDRKSIELSSRNGPCSQRVQAVFIVSDPVDWSRDIQVLCDILSTGGLPEREISKQPPLYFASDDLLYQGRFPTQRLGMGAFRIALESVYNRVYPIPLDYTSYGKPNPSVFKDAETTLKQFVLESAVVEGPSPMKTLYMIGDNPFVDINGAQQAGRPWFSILTRTGVFRGKENHPSHPADLVVDTVEEAVDYILRKETT